MNNSNTFYKTFTGTDTLAFAIFPEAKPILLGSLTTISYSMYRDKKPVPLVGKINVGGYTRGMRSIAGTMVFTLINQHITKDLVEQLPYLKIHGKMKADELPFFDILIVGANEYGASSQMMIYGAEFFEDGQVLSIQDLYIENTFSFVARDIDEFTFSNPIVNKGEAAAIALNVDTIIPYDFHMDGYNRNLKSVVDKKNEDAINIQSKLMDKGYLGKVSGIYDNETVEAITMFQRDKGLNVTGVLDDATHDMLMNDRKSAKVITIENKNGAFIYSNTNKDNIIGISKYKDNYVTDYNGGEFAKVNFHDIYGYVEIKDTSLAPILEFKYDDLIESSIRHKIKLSDFDAGNVGAILSVNKECEVKVSTISQFPNGEIESHSRFYTVNPLEPRKLVLSYISDGYIYSLKQKSMPNLVEFIILPNGGKPKKWIVELI